MARGKFIAFEGIDGAGSTTQAERLRQWMISRGMEVYLTKEPSDGPLGSLIRLVLAGRLVLDPVSLALLFAADRIDHVVKDVEPKLELGVNVISDRYSLSSLAYQSIEAEMEWVVQINQQAPQPDITIIVDTPAEIAARRIQRHRWHVELYEDLTRLIQVRENYLKLAEDFGKRGFPIQVVDGSLREQDVHKEVVRHIQRQFAAPTKKVEPTRDQMGLWRA